MYQCAFYIIMGPQAFSDLMLYRIWIKVSVTIFLYRSFAYFYDAKCIRQATYIQKRIIKLPLF